MHADVVICGAGIAGIAAAYHLAVREGVGDVLLVDERPPMSLTSDKSTEAYRNWWPGPDDAMVRFMNRSIDLMEELADACGNRFLLNRRGYVYATARPEGVEALRRAAEEGAALGAGAMRLHEGRPQDPPYHPAVPHDFHNQPDGVDLILNPAMIRRHFPYLAEDTLAVLHARRCGWLSGQQFGMVLLEKAQAAGTRLLEGHVAGVEVDGIGVSGVVIETAGETTIVTTRCFVDAAGPFVADVARYLDVELPVFCERHLKVNFRDHLGVIPRDAPMVIWTDPQHLVWSEEEREMWAESEETLWLLDEFPPAIHFRPEGGEDSPMVLMLWPYHLDPMPPVLPVPIDPDYYEVVVRGMTRLVPGLKVYLERMPKPIVDGGYYTKTRENRPLICPLPVDGAYVIGALSGYGLMAAAAAGELLALHVTKGELPEYASAFDLKRYQDPAYLKQLEGWEDTSQL
ncbi:MAG: FAD-binding oxidoreductase [Caldilineae bacterium]|nr:MAG: FAD-binding oxidoreductase [Caldilineae bacterium]